MAAELETVVIRDWTGGLNAADDDHNLASKFQTLSDNVNVGSDNVMSVRYGSKLGVDCKDGVETNVGNVNVTLATTNAEPYITVTHTAHGFSSGDHIEISGAADINGIPADDINGKHGIVVTAADTYRIACRTAATATGSGVAQTWGIIHDTHTLTGDLIGNFPFKDTLYLVDTLGEVAKFENDTLTVIWNPDICNTQNGVTVFPWRRCSFVNADIFKHRILVFNGRGNDKPLEIYKGNPDECRFYIDPATSSNSFIPRGDYVRTMGGYTVVGSTDRTSSGVDVGETYLEIGAKNALGLFADAGGAGNDGVNVDLSGITNAADPRITGLGVLRDNLWVSFADQSMLGILGVYSGSAHEPEFEDTISEHGSVSHRSIVSLGNELLACDHAGVPSATVSNLSGAIIPERMSDFIDPMIQKNLKRLTPTTKKEKIFAVFSPRERQYMLFVPKYEDNDVRSLNDDPFYLPSVYGASGRAILTVEDHGFEAGDILTITGATDIGTVTAANINGDRKIISVIDQDTLCIQLGTTYTDTQGSGGGSAVTAQPINDETLIYVYTRNQKLRINRWTRWRGLQASCAARTSTGEIYFGWKGKVYILGSNQIRLHADYVGDYDYRVWNNSFAYVAGDRVLDSSNGKVYKCLVDHTSSATGTFADYRTANEDHWEEYFGEPITFATETPWSDLGEREVLKHMKYVGFDTKGKGTFTFSMFVDNVYRDPSDESLAPARSMQFVGDAIGGFGRGAQPFGGGRRTREQWLYVMPQRGMLFKLRFEGSTTEPLSIVAVRLSFLRGSIRR